MKNILVTGGSGLVGSNFITQLSTNKDYNLISLYNDHPTDFKFCKNIKVDITNRTKVLNLRKLEPDIIIHCAAITNFAFCELYTELARNVNVTGSRNIALLAKDSSSKLVYLSTDAVFSGNKGNYNENDKPTPATVYGETKLLGEKVCFDSYDNTIVVRTNMFGKNIIIKKLSFIENILHNLKNENIYLGFIDSKKTPIFVVNLLDIIMRLVKKDTDGIYQVGGNDPISNYDFARLVAKTFDYDVNLIKKASIEIISKDIRYPKNVTLDNSKLLNFLNYDMPKIKQMLQVFKEDLGKT